MPTPKPAPIEYRIVVAKQARQLDLLSAFRLERSYDIVLGRNSAADKSVEGDQATPLGEFYICAKNPRSRHFLSLCVSYPNVEDAELAPAMRYLLDRLKIQIRYLEPAEWRAWAGMAKTLALFAVPRKVLTTIKAEWRSWHPEPGRAAAGSNLPRGASEIAKRRP